MSKIPTVNSTLLNKVARPSSYLEDLIGGRSITGVAFAEIVPGVIQIIAKVVLLEKRFLLPRFPEAIGGISYITAPLLEEAL